MRDHVSSTAHGTTFVAREQELAQLAGFLERALAGQRQVVFVTGEAGAGKTALVTEFARRAQAEHEDLLVAIGDCNAQTGIGDPYLPFREVLGLLTGDVESKLAQGAITQENASRLQDFLRFSGQALLEYGPDLIDIFVPGGALATRLAGKLAKHTGWAERLEELTQHKARAAASQSSGLDQSHIFEQYTNVLQALAAQRPLILVVDDLQWADTASIGLLFHLGRRMADSRILLLGAYRPDEVAVGRATAPTGPALDSGRRSGQLERHPLEKVLAEFKRYFGDVVVDLSDTEAVEGRRFVDALLDSELNRFGETFRQALYEHTGGHPLFTVELLRNLQERGDVIQDEQAYWVASAELNWGALPARVEGVIEERTGRLEAELREALTVASVEGEDFTAQVVARVQALNERELVRRLTQELDRRHRLVQEQGIERVGGQRLSLYRFRHNLFQRYLYNHLGETEREFLHEDVGNVLEELYAGEAHEIAVQLAEHFLRAGLDDRALPYLIQAGDAAARRYANAEAALHYTRALDVTRHVPASDEQLLHLYSRRGRAQELNGRYDQALANYEEMKTAADERGDRGLRLAALTALATLHSTPNPTFDPAQAETALEEAIALARELGDRGAEAGLLWNLMLIPVFSGGDPHQAIARGEEALALARELRLYELVAFTLGDLSLPYWATGRFEQSQAALHEATELWRELDNLPMLTDSLSRSSVIDFAHGNCTRAIAFSEEAFQISQSSNNSWGLANSRFMLGNVYLDRGEPNKAFGIMEEAIRAGEQAGHLSVITGTRAELALAYGMLGAIERGLAMARLARDVATDQFPLFRPWTTAVLARLQLMRGELAEAEAAVQASYRDLKPETVMVFVPIAVALADGELRLATGDYNGAVTVMAELLDYLESRAPCSATDARYIKAQALLGLGEVASAQETLLTARAAAEALGSRRTLWPILSALAEIEAQRGNTTEADDLRRQACEIVDYIAARAPTPELRASFLERADVRAVTR